MSLRRAARRRFGSRGVRFAVVFSAGALAVGVTIIAARAAGAAGAAGTAGTSPQGGEPAVPAVEHQVSAAAQRAALTYWTPARMRAAQSQALLPEAARSAASPPPDTPSAIHFTGVPTTGALFYTTGTQEHFCSGSVVDSAVGDLVLTAAHCVYSTKYATNIEYVPEYSNGHQPYGGWAVGTITVAAAWTKDHDPNYDFAFVTVSPRAGHKIQAVTGGLTPGFTRWYRETIEVIGYNDYVGSNRKDPDQEPVRCLTKSFPVSFSQGKFMEFYCKGFSTGTSGGPWIIGYDAKNGSGTVLGVIGGYQEGGDYPWASYSSYFGPDARILYGQAERASAPSPSPSPTPTSTGTAAAETSPKPSPAGV